MIHSKYKKLSINSDQFIPEGVKDNSAKLEEILKAYYEWAELDGNFHKESKVLAESFTYTNASDNYIQMFKDTLLRLFPDKHKSILKHLLKFSKSFYESRGTPESYEFFFRAIWDVDVKINNPSDYILKSSDGTWVTRKLMRVDTVNFDTTYCIIRGKSSNSSAVIIDRIDADEFTELVIENVIGNFNIDELVEFYSNSENKIVGMSRTLPSIISYKIINPGLGYSNNKLIFVKNVNAGRDFNIEINTTDYNTGAIISLSIKNRGTGYLYEMPDLELDNLYLFRTNAIYKEPAVIELVEGVIYNEPGYYDTPKSMLSDIWKLADGNYHQEFSYEIETELPLEEFYKPVMELLHPAGTKMFYKYMRTLESSNYTLSSLTEYTTLTEYIKDRKLRYSAINADVPRFGRGGLFGNDIQFTSESDISSAITVKKYGDTDAKYS